MGRQHMTKDIVDETEEVTVAVSFQNSVGLCGVYILRDGDGEPLYVGQSTNIHARIGSHSAAGKIPFVSVTIIEVEAEDLNDVEGLLIRTLCPPYNSSVGAPVSVYWKKVQHWGPVPKVYQDFTLLAHSPSYSFRGKTLRMSKASIEDLALSRIAPSLKDEITPRKQNHSTDVSFSQPDRFVTAEYTRTLLGGVSDMTLWRWLNDPTMAFPKPTYINKRRYWKPGDIEQWLLTHCAPK